MQRLISKKIIILSFAMFLFLTTSTLNAQQSIIDAQDREIIFQSDDFTLYGTLSLPAHLADEKLPVIILLHGSGPQDRDETFTINGLTIKPFKELADALRSQGFIVLRYDKRSFTMLLQKISKEKFDTLMPDAYIGDARAAIDFVKEIEEVDPQRIILVGHSQSGSFMPFIIKDKNVMAAILLAPVLLPFREQTLYQLEYQITYLKNLNTQTQLNKDILQSESLLKELRNMYAMVDNGTFPKGGYILGAPLAHILRLQELTKDVPGEIVKMKIPVLIINGTTDMQCPAQLLKERESFLKTKSDLEIVYIDNMIHHLYRAGTAYFEADVANNIIKWINKLL